MDDFQALNIKSIPRRRNVVVDTLAISAIPDNITNFQVFQDDQHILEFIMCSLHFEGQEIDDTPDDRPEDDGLDDKDVILNLKTNSIPKGWLNLNASLIMMNQHSIEGNQRM